MSVPAILSRAETFALSVAPEDRMGALAAALPPHVKPERFKRNLIIAVAQHPKLLDCDPLDVFAEVSKAAALGLLLDPQLGEAYLITGYDSRRNGLVPQLRIGYRGLMKLGRQSGEIALMYAAEFCEQDQFRVLLGDEKRLHHEPDFTRPRGEVVGYYAVVRLKDGTIDFDVMTLGEVWAIRDRSDGWKAFKAGKIKSTPWSTDEGEMAKKTVLRRLMKRMPQSPDLAQAFQIEDADYQEVREVQPRVKSDLRARLAPPKPARSAAKGFDPDMIEAGLVTLDGEVIDPPAEEQFSRNPGEPEPDPKATAAEWADKLEADLRSAEDDEARGEVWIKAAKLRARLDAVSPERLVEIEQLFNKLMLGETV